MYVINLVFISLSGFKTGFLPPSPSSYILHQRRCCVFSTHTVYASFSILRGGRFYYEKRKFSLASFLCFFSINLSLVPCNLFTIYNKKHTFTISQKKTPLHFIAILLYVVLFIAAAVWFGMVSSLSVRLTWSNRCTCITYTFNSSWYTDTDDFMDGRTTIQSHSIVFYYSVIKCELRAR